MRWLFAVFVLLAACVSAGLAEPTDALLKDKVDHLVRQLKADERSAREQAESQLIELGPQSLEFLPPADAAALGQGPADAIGRIRESLERKQALQATQASLITLHASDASLAKSLGQISQQSGNSLRLDGPDSKLTLALDKVPFWQAFDQMLDQTKLSLNESASGRRLVIVTRPESAALRLAAISHSGAFRVEAKRLTADQNLRPGDKRSLRLAIQIAWEPRLSPIAVQLPLKDIHAIDGEGHALKIENAAGQLEDISPASWSSEFQIHLASPPPTVRRLQSVTGTVLVTVPVRTESFEFADLSRGVEISQTGPFGSQKRADVNVSLNNPIHDGDAWAFDVDLHYASAGVATESFRSWIDRDDVYLLRPNGEKVKPAQFSALANGQHDGYKLRVRFKAPADLTGWRLICRAPVMIAKTPVNFELKDLPCP